jgi:hypothetical protein
LRLEFTVLFLRQQTNECFDQLIFQKVSARLPDSDLKIPFPCNEKRKLTIGIKDLRN